MNDLAVISDEIDGTSDEFSKVREEIHNDCRFGGAEKYIGKQF